LAMSLISRYLYIGHVSNLKIPLHTAVQRLHVIFKRTPPVTSPFKCVQTRSLVVNVNKNKNLIPPPNYVTSFKFRILTKLTYSNTVAQTNHRNNFKI